MSIVADEGVEGQIVARLREDGHAVLYVAEMGPGIADTAVLALANTHGFLLTTADTDFGELVYRQRLVHHGVVLLRLGGLTSQAKAETVSQAFMLYGSQMSGDTFSVITPGKVRVRPRPSPETPETL